MNPFHLFGRSPSTEDLPILNADGPTLASLDHAQLAEAGRSLLIGLSRAIQTHLEKPRGLLSMPVAPLSQLMVSIPGLRTLDPDAMNAADVSRLAAYTRGKHPAVFEDAMMSLAEDWPAAAMALQDAGEALRVPFAQQVLA